MGLGHKTEHCSVTIKARWFSDRSDLEGGLAVAVKEFVAETAGGILVSQLDYRRAVPLDIDNCDQAIGKDALHQAPRVRSSRRIRPPHVRFRSSRRWLAQLDCASAGGNLLILLLRVTRLPYLFTELRRWATRSQERQDRFQHLVRKAALEEMVSLSKLAELLDLNIVEARKRIQHWREGTVLAQT